MRVPVLYSTIPTVPIRTCHRMLHCYMYTIVLNRDISRNAYDDASLGMLRRRLTDKAIEAGRRIILVDPRWTSQVCCGCGACVKKGLKVRTHVCPECGLVMDRDLNSAVNILIWGLTGNPFPERWDE